MFKALSPDEALTLLNNTFSTKEMQIELVPIYESLNRILGRDIVSQEFIPSFTRSTVDGYAVMASDTFGCSESIPAMLEYIGEVEMGCAPKYSLKSGQCIYVPTGGQLPSGADAMVMIEYVEDYGDGLRYIGKPSAPGQNTIVKGDDISPGSIAIKSGKQIKPHDIGSLAALGNIEVPVRKKPIVGILSTGDELIEVSEKPSGAQIRDVNSHALYAAVLASGGQPKNYGIIRDEREKLFDALKIAVNECDIVLLSGGSSVGVRDLSSDVINELGKPGVILHGIAIKPGKPTIIGNIDGKAVIGLPGHPMAAYFIFNIFVKPLLWALMRANVEPSSTIAQIDCNVPSNHGREECIPVALKRDGEKMIASPIMGKSGLINLLSRSEGYIRIPRDREGYESGATVTVYLF